MKTSVQSSNTLQDSKYPVDKAARALKSLEDLLDTIESKRNSHFTPDEWLALVKAESILSEYLYDITH